MKFWKALKRSMFNRPTLLLVYNLFSISLIWDQWSQFHFSIHLLYFELAIILHNYGCIAIFKKNVPDTVDQFFSGFSSSWSEWSSCSKTCGDGEKTRKRSCDNFCVQPHLNPFESSETKSCNELDCKLFPKFLIKFTILH